MIIAKNILIQELEFNISYKETLTIVVMMHQINGNFQMIPLNTLLNHQTEEALLEDMLRYILPKQNSLLTLSTIKEESVLLPHQTDQEEFQNS